jgi:hypothetical protein
MAHTIDLNLAAQDISGLTSAEAVAAFLTHLGYATGVRTALTPEAVGLAGETAAAAVKQIELLAADPEGMLRVLFVQLRSLTARSRNDLARALGKTNPDHLLILASDFNTLEFVLLHKWKREQRGPAGGPRIQVVPLTVAVNRRDPGRPELRMLRRLTWTCRDGLDQFDKLHNVFEAAAYTGDYFQNRALFADHYLQDRLRDDERWKENPSAVFTAVKDLLADGRRRWHQNDEPVIRGGLFEPLFQRLGFQVVPHKPGKADQPQPDYLLKDSHGQMLTAAFV